MTEALDQAARATDELRELAHGILPAVLTHGGLRAAVQALASRMPMPVTNGVTVGRLPAVVEATAYFVVAEALTNVAKHAQAEQAAVTASLEDGTLRVQVRDDGVGGARPEGSGLLGLGDRLAALDGRLWVGEPGRRWHGRRRGDPGHDQLIVVVGRAARSSCSQGPWTALGIARVPGAALAAARLAV